MSILRIDNFGGEIPRVPARSLPGGAAQTNSNLLATATEFRPLLADGVVATATSGSKTLYRLSKDNTGATRTSDAAGWIAEVADKSYVKGQINDDGTERTYVTFNDGSAPPRAIDALGADRLMGVPAPTSVTATLVPGTSFVLEEAQAWADGTLTPALVTAFTVALAGNQITSRVSSSLPVAGAYSLYGMVQVSARPWMAEYFVTKAFATAAGLNAPSINPALSNDGTTDWLAIPVHAFPYWGVVGGTSTLVTTLRALLNPRDGTLLFTETQANAIRDALIKQFNPADASIQPLRASLDNQVKTIRNAIEFVLSAPNTAPTAPTKPTVPEYTFSGGTTDASDGDYARAPEWFAYDAAVITYTAAVSAFAGGQSAQSKEIAANIVTIAAAQTEAARLTQEIESIYASRFNGLSDWIKALITERGLAKSDGNPDGLVVVDPNRITDSRFYFVTHTTDWGDESAPSPLTPMLDVDQYSSVTLTFATAPSGRYITTRTVYRSNVGTTGAGFQFVAAIPVATGTYSDTLKSAELGEICPTITWTEPPAALRGLVGMPNGVMAGFVDNYVAFCDPYHPYAWPTEYQIPLKYDIVGLGSFGQSLFVGTTANPSIISGSDSGSMSEQVLDDAQACLSARSIVSMGGGVLYASPDGICFASGNGVQVITTALFAREDWQALQPASIRAATHEGIYYFWYSGTYGGVTGGCLALDMVAKKLTRVGMQASAVFTDSLTDAVFYVSGAQVLRAFSTGRRTGIWKSGKTVLPSYAPFAWLQVDGDQSPSVPATVRWYGDGVLRHTAVLTNMVPVRLPAGRYLEHEIEIESAARITKVVLAGTTQELQAQ